MAQALDFVPPERDVKAALYAQLKDAPTTHVEALLDVYTIIQLLHNKGIFELLKGALGSGEKVLGVVTETMEKDDVIRTLRNLVILFKIIGSFEPDTLEGVLKAVSQNSQATKTRKPAGLIHIVRKLSSADSRRILEPLSVAVESLGKQTGKSAPRPAGRKRISRHDA